MVELDSEWRPPALVAELAWCRDEAGACGAVAGRALCSALRVRPGKLRRHEQNTLYLATPPWPAVGCAAPYLRARKAPAYGRRIGERFAFKLPAMR
ncbi:hypothetical protein PPTS312_00070 [Pseudomonas putida]|uniref:Uncharacterized protein n=1 Tax=Pseudomonas putida TaxID=303 RepID=A0A7U6LXE9_PSEPU|nr:hypothetical protein PPTS312_00070 [Pseudomonas putida]